MSISCELRNLVFVTMSLVFAISSVHAQTPTRAFYYNASSKLLQIEDLDPVNMSSRLTQEIAAFPIPRMVKNTRLSPACDAANPTQQMAYKATFAIYWGVDDVNDDTEMLRPLHLEYLKNVNSADRTIECVPIHDDDTACPQGTRCMTGCVSCTSYCCVK